MNRVHATIATTVNGDVVTDIWEIDEAVAESLRALFGPPIISTITPMQLGIDTLSDPRFIGIDHRDDGRE